jgi:hypothetical protein
MNKKFAIAIVLEVSMSIFLAAQASLTGFSFVPKSMSDNDIESKQSLWVASKACLWVLGLTIVCWIICIVAIDIRNKNEGNRKLDADEDLLRKSSMDSIQEIENEFRKQQQKTLGNNKSSP